MKTIWKYDLTVQSVNVLSIPGDYTILHIGNQAGTLCLWAMVNPDGLRSKVKIEIIGTGHAVHSAERVYLGTSVIDPYVWHVFHLKGE